MRLLHEEIDNYLARNMSGFHSPAHGSREEILCRDLSELSGLDDLSMPIAVIKDTHEFIAGLFNAKNSFMLINGTSQGIHAAILSLAAYAEMNNLQHKKVLLARNVHRSVLAGLILAGLDFEFLDLEWNSDLGIFTRFQIPEDIVLAKYLALVLTNPSYEGFYSELREIEIPLIVDEAHGAHYHFTEELPQPALAAGADLVLQSWHKCLGSLGQTGVLHIAKNSKISAGIVQRQLNLLQSTSPSYLLMDSISRTAGRLAAEGTEIFKNALALASLVNFPTYINDDPLRVNIQIPSIAGELIDDFFEEQSLVLEKHSAASALAFINYSHQAADIEFLNSVYAQARIHFANFATEKNTTLYELRNSKPRSFTVENLRQNFFRGDFSIEAPCPPGIVL